MNSTLERIKKDGTLSKLYDKWMAEYLGPQRALPQKYRTPEESAKLGRQRAKYFHDVLKPRKAAEAAEASLKSGSGGAGEEDGAADPDDASRVGGASGVGDHRPDSASASTGSTNGGEIYE